MKILMRRYQFDEDYWRIRRFLRDNLLLNNREQVNWEVARFDYWRWHGILNMKDGALEEDVFIWQTDDGQFAAVLNREAPGSVFLHMHPRFRSENLIKEMLSTAERHLAVPTTNRRRRHHVWVERCDSGLKSILASQGYRLSPTRKCEHQRRRFLPEQVGTLPVADGYTIRSLGDIEEHHARCWVSWRAFHPDECDKHFEDGWYHNIQRAPLYRRDLDLVAVAPNGELAAFCTIWFDDDSRTGLFEPVGTAPEYQKRGLGKGILTEGLVRLRRLGANVAYVGSYTEAAHALYASVGFETYRIIEPWEKESTV